MAPHSAILLSGFRFGAREEDGSLVKELIRFGVEFPDGGKATNLDDIGSPMDDGERVRGLEVRGSSGSPGRASGEFWIWPVPDAGDLVLVCAWPAYGIAESGLTVSGEELRAAAGRARPVWPDEPACTRRE